MFSRFIIMVNAIILVSCGSAQKESSLKSFTAVGNTKLSKFHYSASEKVKNCPQFNLDKVDVKLDHNSENSKKLDYYYQYIAAKNISDVTVIFLPGGPGDTSIGADINKTQYPFFNRIYLDPRGTGCNFNLFFPYLNSSKTITTLQYVNDIIQIIKKRQMQKFIIYGLSYGTLAATVLNSELNKQRLTLPVATVLEGVLGKSKIGGNGQQIINTWNDFVTQNPEIVRTFFNPFLYKMNKRFFINFVTATMYNSVELTKKILLDFNLEYNMYLNGVLDKSYLIRMINRLKNFSKRSSFRGSLNMFCKLVRSELSGNDYLISPNDFYQGQLYYNSNISGEVCPRSNEDFKYYNSADYQIKSPIYYFHGTHDPVISYSDAKYHFGLQNDTSYKELTLVSNAGHTPLHHQLTPCIQAIWQAIAKNNKVSPLLNDYKYCLAQYH